MNTTQAVRAALAGGYALTVDMDGGTFTLSGADLEQTYEQLAPGEGFHILAHEKATEYISQPVNFGADTPDMRAAEYDAFLAGWKAAKGD